MNERGHKAGFNLTRKMLEENRKAGYEHGYSVGYNEAIDDLTANITKRFFGMAMSSGLQTEGATWENAIRQVKQIAEQLKGEKRNEDYKQKEIQ
jgi:hypothetical protein